MDIKTIESEVCAACVYFIDCGDSIELINS
jgi:hypothetical protein